LKLPVELIRTLLCPPGSMNPVLNAPLLAVAVWTVESAFLQITVWPTFALAELGE
jgi:hypothetical protein